MYFFQRLEFKRYLTNSEIGYTELNDYADFTFANGIFIRVSTGMMTDTTPYFPYEAHVIIPYKNPRVYPCLSKSGLNNLMNNLHLYNVPD